MSLPRQAALENLRKSRHFSRLPLWRSTKESDLIARLVFQWEHAKQKQGFAPCGKRALAKKLGTSQTWVQKLCKRFRQRPDVLQRIVLTKGMASMEQLAPAIEETYRLREAGKLRRKIRWRNLSPEEAKLERQGHRYRMAHKGRFD